MEGGGEKRKRLPANPTILENAPRIPDLKSLLCSLLSPPPSFLFFFFLLSSQLSRRTRVETLATQATLDQITALVETNRTISLAFKTFS